MMDLNRTINTILAGCDLAPEFILVFYLVSTIFWRDLEAPAAIVGELLNIALNRVLKRVVKQQRPHGAQKLGHGMPSNHAQIVTFFAVHIASSVLPPLDTESEIFRLVNQRELATIVGLLVVVVLVCFSRVHLGFHTLEQVLVGAGVGTAAGVAWLHVSSGFSDIALSIINGLQA